MSDACSNTMPGRFGAKSNICGYGHDRFLHRLDFEYGNFACSSKRMGQDAEHDTSKGFLQGYC